jgi:hypothetical protein
MATKDKPGEGGTEWGSNGHNPGPAGTNVGPSVEAEPVEPPRPERIAHLAANRHLIIKRSLLASALGGIIPIPVVDEYVAGRVRAGLLLKLAEQRQVDMLPSSAELMGDPREGSALRHATITAITLVALKLAWRKFFAVLALGRGAEEMAITFQFATLFDHYCSRMHVGGRIEREQAAKLRTVIHATVAAHERSGLVAIFRDAGRILGRSALEAPAWMRTRFAILAQRWVSTRGDVNATLDPNAPGLGTEGEAQWLDKAADSVEERLGALGEYLARLLADFEHRWAEVLAAPPPPVKPTAA